MTNLDLLCISRDTILFTMIICMIYNLYSFAYHHQSVWPYIRLYNNIKFACHSPTDSFNLWSLH